MDEAEFKDKEVDHNDGVASVSGRQNNVLMESGNSDEDEECDNCSEYSEIDCSQTMEDLYSVEELNEFLDLTKGKKVDVSSFFPDANKFIKSVVTRDSSEDGGL